MQPSSYYILSELTTHYYDPTKHMDTILIRYKENRENEEKLAFLMYMKRISSQKIIICILFLK